MSRLTPPTYYSEASVQVSMRLPGSMVKRLDEIAKAQKQGRTDMVVHFLNHALEQYDAEIKEKEAAEKAAKR